LHVGSSLSLQGFADQPLPLNTRMSAFRLLPETLRLFNEALIKWGIMLNEASRHMRCSVP
jgi:hypothetical protein